jgi:hypothetical protein
MEQVMHCKSLSRYILEFIPNTNLNKISKGYRDMVQEIYIDEYVSYIKGDSPIPHSSVIEILNRMTPSQNSLLFIQSHIPSFISLREPILPLFKSYVKEIRVQDLLSRVDKSISRQVLLHMDQCMYNYNTNNILKEEVIKKLLNIARSYITRGDIKSVHDIQPHHRYVIIKSSEITAATQIDVILTEVFGTLQLIWNWSLILKRGKKVQQILMENP